MFRKTAFLSFAAIILVMVVSGSVRAADDYMKIIPHDALGWGAIDHLADGNAKIRKLGAAVGNPSLNVLSMVKDKLGVKSGLDTLGAAGVIAMPPKVKKESDSKSQSEPMLVFFVAVKDYDVLLADLEPDKPEKSGSDKPAKDDDKKDANAKISKIQLSDEPAVAARLGAYALLAKSDDQAALEQVLASKTSAAAEVKPLQTWLAGNDANIVVLQAGVKMLAEQGKAGLKKSGESLGALGEQGKLAKAGLQLYAAMFDAAEKNIALGALGLQVDKLGNVRLASRVKAIAGGQLATMLAGAKPGQGKLLAGLSNGNYIFAGGAAGQTSLFRPFIDLSSSIMKGSPDVYGITSEQAEKLGKISGQYLKGTNSMSMVMKVGSVGEPIFSSIYGMFGVDNADEFLENYEKQTEATREILKTAKEGMLKPPVSKKIEIDGKPALEIQMTMPVPKAAGNPIADKMMQAIYGADNKLTMLLMKDDAKTVYMSFGGNKERLLRVIADSKIEKRKLAADEDVAATVALLPAGAQSIALFSPRGYMEMTQRMVMAMMGQNNSGITIPQFPNCPPIGFSMQAWPSGFTADMVVPAGMIQAAAEYWSSMQQRMLTPPPQQVQ
jgi:hypothetical protein